MKTGMVVSALALALGAAPALADRARVREGGSDRSSSGSDAAARHPGSGSSSGASTSSGGHSSGNEHVSGSGSSSADLTPAQRRHPRPGSGTGHHGRVVYRGYPRSYGGYYGPGYYGYYGHYDWWYSPYGYPGYGYGYRYGYRDDDDGSLRLLVHPNQARVYVDGYYAGVVDDFDGLFQRLRLPSGRHEIAFKLEGYKTHRVRLYVPYDHTLKIKHDLIPGEGDESLDDSLDRPALEWIEKERERERHDGASSRYERRRTTERRERRLERAPDGDEAVEGAARLSLDVRPERAAVYVDGAFRGTAGEVRELRLPPGRHRVEVVAPGFRTFDREVELRAGETEALNVELERT